jgi:6-pyruvoyltetrahydropterin/6-carboxytetrahydropterin synthase
MLNFRVRKFTQIINIFVAVLLLRKLRNQLNKRKMKVAVYRKAHFNAAHRLYNKSWSEEKNDEVFGLCNNPNWHGHNYELVVKLVGEVDPETGYVIDLKILKDIIKTEVEDRFDHKNLNMDCVEFANLIPTVENISVVIYNLLRAEIDTKYDIKVRLYETERNFVEYPA